jgi:hypothetical protein
LPDGLSSFTLVLPKGTIRMIHEERDVNGLPIVWDIHREGRPWTRKEFDERANRLMELKFEIVRGKLFWSEETRRMVLAMLLENVGMDAAVHMGDPACWKEAIDGLLDEPTQP